jgi:CelD/BcsL family acetyltransferase involved in cellulose biosynthesis
MAHMSAYQAKLSPLPSMNTLQGEWEQVERESDAGFFLSWTWICSWLQSMEPQAELLRIHCEKELVGIALLVVRKTHGGFVRSLVLHQTGDELQDQIWTEYNDVLAKREYAEGVRACFADFLKSWNGWDEFVLGASHASVVDFYAKRLDLPTLERWKTDAYGVSLEGIDGDFLNSLSRNTRYQINRSFKAYAKDGFELKLVFADTKNEALAFFDQAGPFHKQRWGAKPEQSGFANPVFMAFHHRLITNAWGKGEIALACLKHGERDLGYFYFFIYRNVVYFYLSGLVQEQNSKLKPGLCGHTLIIEHFKSLGMVYYDLMGGDDRYKKSIASKHSALCRQAIRRPTKVFRVESALRKVKHGLAGMTIKAGLTR